MLPFSIFITTLLTIIAVGSLATISSHPHWLIRGWDFPHVQLACITAIAAACYFIAARFFSTQAFWNWVIGGFAVLILAWLAYGIIPYTRFSQTQTKRAVDLDTDRRLCVVVSNVEMENTQHELWMQTMSAADPDIAIVLEVNDRWMSEIEPLRKQYAHEIAYPQDNWYGMLLLSKFPVLESEILFRVSDDVPSMTAVIELPSGESVRVLAVHPRPPEPIRDNDSVARDAELVLCGRELEEHRGPVIIGGDLNDVAWSSTTRLFLRLSGMLDPRRGRGFFNSFNAKHWWMRFPLDHVFHSRHFTLRRIERLGWVGSDHFPVLLDLQCEPSRKHEQTPLKTRETDDDDAEEMVSRV